MINLPFNFKICAAASGGAKQTFIYFRAALPQS